MSAAQKQPNDRTVVVVLALRVEVTGKHLSDGLALSGGIACDAIGIPDGGWQPARPATTFHVEAFGKPYEVKAIKADTVAVYEKHGGWIDLPELSE